MSARLILTSAIIFILVAALTAEDDQQDNIPSYAEFRKQYGLESSSGDISSRASTYAKNVELIKSTNKKNLPYKLGVNRFADLPLDKLQELIVPAARNFPATLKGNHRHLTEATPPERKDWREDGIVSPVKNQGQCGSCWAFSAIGAIEAAIHQAKGISIDLSEQELLDCSGAFNNFACQGGFYNNAFDYIKSNGISSESEYPYLGITSVCRARNGAYKIRDYVKIPQGAEDELKRAVGLVGPVSVAFKVTDELMMYQGGVFTTPTCGSDPRDVNYAGLVVGYGVENGIPYWLIQNSWGTAWGENGYFKMERGKNMCGIASYAAYPVL